MKLYHILVSQHYSLSLRFGKQLIKIIATVERKQRKIRKNEPVMSRCAHSQIENIINISNADVF